EVLEQSHRLIFDLLAGGQVTGLRVDHADGLRDPTEYFDRLQQAFASRGGSGRLYVVAEKIFSGRELLPANWRLEGTTGYDFLNYLNGVFIARQNEKEFTDLYSQFTGRTSNYADIAYQSKKELLWKVFPAEVRSLTERLKKIAEQTIVGVDFTTGELQEGI